MMTEIQQPYYALTSEEKQYTREMVADVVAPYHTENFDTFMQSCQKAAALLPERLLDWRSETAESDVGLLRNLPTEDLFADTPEEPFVADHIPLLSDSMMGVIAALFGDTFFFDKAVCRGAALRPHGTGATTQAVWTGLLCVHGDEQAVVKIARYDDIQWYHEQLSSLIGSICSQGVDCLFHKEYAASVKLAMLAESEEKPAAMISSNRASAEQVYTRVVLEKGDLLMFNSRNTIHAHSASNARMHGKDRWIKRVLVADDIM
ncbi:hypothetical protein JHJ32_09380 [Parapedobacter sp. ISTM3]|uniref:Taurine catabolism dioxygenase TauD, TfdA family n=1 Tax=Parapedobacter luteus TaxID=623280 RepID=A0A1T5A5T2_9SPHI|nr:MULTISPECIES: hypothetical protein [Parapedobacter]MBK1440196.1 hypothetical protein [Parapedobacter sp. ISTM3]SKB30107.1 hypothetical protein SAMN05660226_00600 [Parapedobacter luteus]